MLRFLIIVISFYTVSGVEYAPVIQIDSGLVRGFRSQLNDNSVVDIYQGIRYGEAKRFEKSKFVEKWSGIYDAIEQRDTCPQPGKQMKNHSIVSNSNTMSEDCLYLSVYKPERSPKIYLPVMVWIHGGAFITGSIFDDIYNPSYMVSMGKVIVVTINYRLGAFGFLYDGTDNAPGNQGLHDQILALKWVQNNIGHFGGDPNRVTIFGESAGSMSISALILSPLTKGLFGKAILQSGATNAYLGSCEKNEALNKTIHLAQRLNCYEESFNSTMIIECLRNTSVEDILNATKDDILNGRLMIPIYGETLMPISPNKALETKQFNPIDIMFGVNRNEGSSFVKRYFSAVQPDIKHPNMTLSKAKALIWLMMMVFEKSNQTAQKITNFYMKQLNDKSNMDDIRIIIADAFGDYHLVCPTMLFGEYFSRGLNSSINTFYSYRLILPLSNGPLSCKGWEGVCHGEDVVYLFHVPMDPHTYTKQEIQLSNDMIYSWTKFAWTGHPNSLKNLDDNQTVEWMEAINQKHKSESVSFMSLDSNHYQMITNFFQTKCDQFWKPILFKE
uniref:Carboxylic ester hydrolase n=1 Tax=Dermatophagoides pteronyssinus TaxID=6956 RepID=A0A6P6Y6T2_DERPT|nr:cholinesterase-like [Dermatophagoides pteronyssinus]